MCKRYPLYLVALAFSACFTFSVPADATQIGETDLYVVGGESSQLPTPSSSSTAPVITQITATQTGTYTFNMYFDVESSRDIAYVYVDFASDGVYRVPVKALEAGGAEPPAACSQGITCTSACLSACGCLSCSDGTIEKNLEQGCAATCSANVSSGAINSAPYNGSEKTLAYVVYNGSPADGIPGTAAQAPGCSTSKCPGAPTSGRTSQTWSIGFTAPVIPETTSLTTAMVETTSSGGAAETSAPFERASVSTCRMGETMSCRH